MKLIKLQNLELEYLARHWFRWYYIDRAGYWNPVKDVITSLEKLKEDSNGRD